MFNSNSPFDIEQISLRIKETPAKARRELVVLEQARLLKRKIFYRTKKKKKNGKRILEKTKTRGWILNENFELMVPLHTFLVNSNHLSPRDISKKLSRTGVIKLVLISGVFLQNPESRVDIMIVGDHIKRNAVESAVKTIEAEMGKELRYAIFETADFQYRMSMYDRLVRDILDYPHEKIINKLGI